ncbi:MAG TPA: alpha/beta fold hydrolase [Trebonia sp.]
MTVTWRGPCEIALPDGGELSAEEAGDGTPVVLLHGFSFDKSLWDPQFPALTGQHQAIRYDLRGFGRSSAPVAARGHVEDLLAVLDAFAISRAHLVGLSLGANIALATAARHPDRVRSVVLASPGLPGYPWTTPRPPDEAAGVARRAGIAAAKEWWLGHEVFRSAERYPAARAHLADMVRRWPAYQWADGPATPPLPSLTGYLGTLRVPALVMNGALDVPGYREIASVLHRKIPGARREEFPDAGHLLNLERPARFTGELLSFLA